MTYRDWYIFLFSGKEMWISVEQILLSLGEGDPWGMNGLGDAYKDMGGDYKVFTTVKRLPISWLVRIIVLKCLEMFIVIEYEWIWMMDGNVMFRRLYSGTRGLLIWKMNMHASAWATCISLETTCKKIIVKLLLGNSPSSIIVVASSSSVNPQCVFTGI